MQGQDAGSLTDPDSEKQGGQQYNVPSTGHSCEQNYKRDTYTQTQILSNTLQYIFVLSFYFWGTGSM